MSGNQNGREKLSMIIKRYSENRLTEATHRSWNSLIKIFAVYPRTEYIETPKYKLLCSGTKIGMLNRVMDTNLTRDEAEKSIQEVTDFFKSRELPFTWQVDPWDRPKNLAGRLENAGFTRNETPGMAVKISQLIKPETPNGFTVEKCDTSTKLSTYARLLCKAYGMPETAWDWLVGAWINYGLTDNINHYIGYLDGNPVATSTIMYEEGVAGLYNVATLPEARGRGIGAMISYSPFMDAEKRGYRFGILHSSRMGYPVYKRLGFHDVCKLIRYEWSPGS